MPTLRLTRLALPLRLLAESVRMMPRPIWQFLYRSPLLGNAIRRLLARSTPEELVEVQVESNILRGARLRLNLRTERGYWLGTHELNLWLPSRTPAGPAGSSMTSARTSATRRWRLRAPSARPGECMLSSRSPTIRAGSPNTWRLMAFKRSCGSCLAPSPIARGLCDSRSTIRICKVGSPRLRREPNWVNRSTCQASAWTISSSAMATQLPATDRPRRAYGGVAISPDCSSYRL
jgi:hypothetical protein